jgi:hypothetical protein
VAQGLPNILSCLSFLDVQVDQAITGVAQCPIEKAMVETEEGRPVQAVQQRENLAVLHSRPAHFDPDPGDAQAPASQELVLVLRDILIENGHALLE